MGPLLPALLGLLLAAPPVRAQSAYDLPHAEAALDQDLNPYYAQDFLKDTAAQHAFASQDPDREAKLVQQAAALKDMSDLMISYVDPASMNEALRLRLLDDDANPDLPKLLGFGAHPKTLLAWRAKYFDYVPTDRVEAALWEWSTLSQEQRDWLSAAPRSHAEDEWEAESFLRRFTDLHEWASAIYVQLMKTSPKTTADLARMDNEQNAIWGVMDGAQKRLSNEYLTKAGAAVEGLQKLEKLPGVRDSSDPAIKDLLAKAQSGATPDETLAALSALFDKAGVHDAAVQTHAPDRPDQNFSSVDPRVFDAMLATGLRDEIGDVPAGQAVDRFFDTHPLKVAVRDLATNLAQFQPATGELVFNERFVTDWIKSQGLSARAVISDPARFHELVMMLAPNFVHESTHQIQKAFADDHGIYAWNAQHQEIEAKEVQSDYMLEKEAKDPAYRQFLLRSRDGSFIVQQDLTQTASFARDPRMFRAVVMSDYYAGLPSLEDVESDTLLFLDSNLDALRAEQSRRAALPEPQRDEIELTGYDRDADFKTMAEWKAYLTKVKPSVLDSLISRDSAERAKALKTYELTSAREDRTDAGIESDAANVLRGDAPAKDAVPAPGGP
ncbi:MAG TPA: hypothetical protein VH309_12885 [Elusimicrobiota bacterium]|jgi:hypothetical protein|nr:hypothetical protein [Elusimicrobiota bacterium]